MFYTFEQANEALNRFQKTQPEIKEIIAFFKEIIKMHVKVKNDLNLPSIVPDKEKTKEKLEKGFPLLELNLIPDFPQESILLREELSKLIKKRGPLVAKNLEKIEHHLLKEDHIFVNLSQNYLLHTWLPLENFIKTYDLDHNLLFFLIKNSVKPFIESMAERVLPTCDLSPWSESICPICGSLPALAFLKPIKSNGDGLVNKGKEKGLSCSLCNHTWQFPRLKCPFCLTDKQDALGYFYLDNGEKGYRVDICNDCKCYIKTIDFEYCPISEELLFLEDIHTINLDLLAEKEGYCKKAEKIF